MSHHVRSLFLLSFVLLATGANGQQLKTQLTSPEMDRLIRAFEGSYTTVERHQPHVGFPNGGIRTGTDVIRASAGGNAMVSEVHSHSSHGDLDYLSVTWWERSSGVYRRLMCAKQFPEGCVTGATAQWEGSKCVRTQEVSEDGKKIVLRDTYSFAPDSFRNIAERSSNGGPMKEIIRTIATREKTHK